MADRATAGRSPEEPEPLAAPRRGGLQVVLVSRRFWPLVGCTEQVMAELATGLRDRGAAVTVLTSQASGDWSARVQYDGVPVVRLPGHTGQRWKTLRFLMALSAWLRDHAQAIDVVCVSQLRWEAYAVLRALRRTRLPVVLRGEAGETRSDLLWQQRFRFGARIRNRCQMAAAIIAPEPEIEQELLAAGYPAERIHRIPNGIPAVAFADGARRFDARAALADAETELTIATDAPLVVYAGRLSNDHGVRTLIEAWRLVARHCPAARLWLVGDGPDREELRDRVLDLNLQQQIQLPGAFEDLEDLLQAASLYVDPGQDPGCPSALLQAVGVGLPVVATTARQLPVRSADGDSGLALVPPGDATGLSQAILRWLEKPPATATLSQSSARVLQDHSLEQMADAHLRLFEGLIGATTCTRAGQP